MASAQPQQINLSELDLPQLADVRRQLEDVCACDLRSYRVLIQLLAPQELSHLTNSFTQLKQAQAKFKACMENAGEVKPGNKGVYSLAFLCMQV